MGRKARRTCPIDIPFFAAYCCLHLKSLTACVQTCNQTRSPAPGRHPQRSAAACSGALVPARWFLRCQRFGAGQVRNASARQAGWRNQGAGCKPVRPIAANLLPGRVSVRARRDCRSAAADSWPEGGAQTHPRSHAGHRVVPPQRRALAGPRDGSAGTRTAGCPGTSTQHRAGSGPQKKTLTNSSTPSSPILAADATPAYERVRAEVMAGHAKADALGAIIFHGMWQGLRVLVRPATASSLPDAPPTLSAAPASTLDRQLVRLLADMVLATQSQVQHVH